MKKRVLVFSLAWLPFVGGAEIAWNEITKRLDGEFDFRVITCRRLGLLDKVLYLPLSILKGLFVKADIVVGVLENQAGLAARFVSWVKGVPCIINLQSGDSDSWIYKKLGIFGFLYDWVYDKSGRVRYVVLSNYLKDRALSHGVPRENITIVPNGVDSKIFSPQKKESTIKQRTVLVYPNILTVSRLVYKNGVDILIKAFSIVHKKFPDCTLTICGVGEDEYKLSKLVFDLQLDQAVAFAGNVDYGALPVYYNNASVFVRPSRSEGFGNSFIEAMSCGIPIIGTKVGGIPDFLIDGKTGLFCEPEDQVGLSRQIIRLLKDEELRERLRVNGLKCAGKYDWNNITKQYGKVLA